MIIILITYLLIGYDRAVESVSIMVDEAYQDVKQTVGEVTIRYANFIK